VETADVADAEEVGGLGRGGHAMGETLVGEKSKASRLKAGIRKQSLPAKDANRR
jgi:hypothetical protein